MDSTAMPQHGEVSRSEQGIAFDARSPIPMARAPRPVQPSLFKQCRLPISVSFPSFAVHYQLSIFHHLPSPRAPLRPIWRNIVRRATSVRLRRTLCIRARIGIAAIRSASELDHDLN
jgi:hypothetical protein